MSEWYSDLAPEELTGKHVRVLLEGGSVLEGRLVFDETLGYVRLDAPQLEVPVDNGTKLQAPLFSLLFETEDGIWYPLMGIESITFVWDEAEWEQIPQNEAVEGDMLVLNGELYPIRKVVPVEKRDGVAWIVGSSAYFVAPGMVSCALRRKGASDGV